MLSALQKGCHSFSPSLPCTPCLCIVSAQLADTMHIVVKWCKPPKINTHLGEDEENLHMILPVTEFDQFSKMFADITSDVYNIP